MLESGYTNARLLGAVLRDVPDGRNVDLIADVLQFQAIRDNVEAARQRGRTACERAMRSTARKSLDLADRIANTTAHTAAGRHASAVAALFDIMQAGEEL